MASISPPIQFLHHPMVPSNRLFSARRRVCEVLKAQVYLLEFRRLVSRVESLQREELASGCTRGTR